MSQYSRSIIVQNSDINEKMKELDELLQYREQILLKNKQSCCYRIQNSGKLIEYNKKRDKVLMDLGRIVYNSLKSISVQVNKI